jgi:hypothetical protein
MGKRPDRVSLSQHFSVEGELMKTYLVLILALMMFAADSSGLRGAENDPVVISNGYLKVCADRATGEITILAKGKPIVTKGWIGGVGGKAKVDVSKVFLPRISWISIRDPDHSGTIGLLHDDTPFAIVVARHRNRGKESMIVNQEPGFRGNVVAFEKPEGVKILGTGGLRKPGERLGSYMWLAVADPLSRSGIVRRIR